MVFTSRLFAARSVGQLHFCTDELRLKCKNRRTSCYMRQRHCGYSFHHFLFFFRISYLLPSLSPLSLSTLSRIFLHLQTISLWASEEGYTDYQVICIIALMNNVVLIMLLIAPYMTSQRYFTFSEFQPTRMHQLLAFFIIPTLCETDVEYDQL